MSVDQKLNFGRKHEPVRGAEVLMRRSRLPGRYFRPALLEQERQQWSQVAFELHDTPYVFPNVAYPAEAVKTK